MEKVKDVVTSNWFKAAAIAGIGTLLICDKQLVYSGIAVGIAIREFLLAFKK